MKILFVINRINYSGAAKIVAWLANKLNSQGNKICVYSFLSDEMYYPLDSGIKHLSTIRKNNKIFYSLCVIRKIRNIVKGIKPDVIVGFSPAACMYSVIACLLLSTPVIVTERSDPKFENSYMNKVKKFFFRFASGAVFQTKGAMENFPKSLQSRSMIIPNPVVSPNTDMIPFEKRRNEIAFAARFDIKQKRQDIMIKAFQRVSKQFDDIKLVFYGDGPDKAKIEKMALDLGVYDKVIFAGTVSNICNIIRFSKLFVLSSDYEGIPNALIEAMSVGLAVVSTDCSPGGARLLIKNGKNGLLVPCADVDKLADAIIFLLKNPKRTKVIGLEAAKITERFSPEIISGMWNQYIRKVITHKT